MLERILSKFNIKKSTVIPFGSGLINHTWKVDTDKKSFILQKINVSVFKKPELIEENIQRVATYLSTHHPSYFFPTPCKTTAGKEMVFMEGEGYFRMFPFIENSVAFNVAENPALAFEAANMFGEFTALLENFPIEKLNITLADFHNLSLRYRQFETASHTGNKSRIANASGLITFLESQQSLVEEYEKIKSSPDFRLRVTHHDTKISNVLFDNSGKGICVIDLDTIMPGYFISDVGDMIRTYISPAGEEEKDFDKVEFRIDYFTAIVKGYLDKMKGVLSPTEINHTVYAGKFMIYMQALRFLTDYLNDDVYYGKKYENHNLVRAGNQSRLLQLLLDNEDELNTIVRETMNDD